MSQYRNQIDTQKTPQAQASDDKTVAISVVIPCFNESSGVENLASVLKELMVEYSNYSFEFVLVDDGSTDDTWELLADFFDGWLNVELVRHGSNQGLMAAILTGVGKATHELVCSMDSDCTYHPSEIPAMVEKMTPEVAIVTSSPYHPQGLVRNVPNWRIRLSRFASTMYRQIMRNKLYCYTSCFRVFRRSVVREIKLKNTGFVGTVELIWRVEQLGDWKVIEVPSTLNVRQFGQSKCRVVQVALGYLRFMAEIIGNRFRRRAMKQAVVVRQDS